MWKVIDPQKAPAWRLGEQCSWWQQLSLRYLSYSPCKASFCLTSHSKITLLIGGSLCWLEFAESSVMLGAAMCGKHFSFHDFFYIFICMLFQYRTMNSLAQKNLPFNIHSFFPIGFLLHTHSLYICSDEDGLYGLYIKIIGTIT